MSLCARLDTCAGGRLGAERDNRPWRRVSRLRGHGWRGRVGRQSRFESGRLLQIDYFLGGVWSQCTRKRWLWMFLPSPLAGSRSRGRAKILATLDSNVRTFCRLNYVGIFSFLLRFEVMIFDLCILVSHYRTTCWEMQVLLTIWVVFVPRCPDIFSKALSSVP